MDPQMKRNQQMARPQPGRQTSPGLAGQRPVQQPRQRSFSKVKIASIVLAIVLVIAALLVVDRVFLSATGVDKDKYQAVFLTNGQAYFGKLHDYGTQKPYMSDVYYFQAGDTPQGDEGQQATQTLVKLGDEIHKPEDKLILNREAILFVENLSGEGSVVQAIEENQ